MRYEHILRSVYGEPWAITPDKLAAILDLLRFRAEGGVLTAEEIQERIGLGAAAPRPTPPRNGSVAVLPIFGVIRKRMNLLMEMSGGTSTELFARDFRQLVADPSVGSIVLAIDSPGGSVEGVPELADVIFSARGQKPVIAVADPLAASAAYWLATQADEVVVAPSAMVGSIGVLTTHEDLSAALEMEGRKVTLISAGRFKAEGNPLGPLSDADREAIQGRVDEFYGMFLRAVARGRGVTPAQVRGGFGEGRVVLAREAVRLGMADRVATLEETVARLMGPGRTRSAINGQAVTLRYGLGAGDEPPEDDTLIAGTLDETVEGSENGDPEPGPGEVPPAVEHARERLRLLGAS